MEKLAKESVGNLPTGSYFWVEELCGKWVYMLIIYLKRLNDFGKAHANARKSLAVWKLVVEDAEWKKKQDVLRDFPKAKMIQNNRARFEIVHNTFRLITYIHYNDRIVEIRFIGINNGYDRVDTATI